MLVSGERWARALRCAALAPCLAPRGRGFGDGVRLRARLSASATGGAAALASCAVGTTLTGERTRGRRYGASDARRPSAPSAVSRRTHLG